MRLPGLAPARLHPRFITSSIALLAAGLVVGLAGSAQAATPTVPLGTADSFAVLAATGVSNVPVSAITGDVGAAPAAGSSITGLTCEEVDGTIYSVDGSGPVCRETNAGLLTTAKTDQTAAYLNAFGRVPDTTFADGDNQLGSQTLAPGVYRFGHAPTANLVGNLTLHGDASSVWIFQATSDLVTASSSTVTLTGGAQACNIFWQVGSSATLGSSSSFVGTVLAQTSIFVQSRATIEGRVLAGTGAVTLDMNTITRPDCATTPIPPTRTPEITTQRQVTEVPRGSVGAGGGSTGAGTDDRQHLMVGALVLSGAGVTALLVARRRRDA